MATKYFNVPFANGGDKTSIPDASQPSGDVSFTDGWTPDYEKDQVTDPDAKDISRQSENYFKFTVTDALKEIQEQGGKPYDALVNYPVGSIIQGSDNNQYRCLVKNGPGSTFLPVVDPVGDTTGTWINYNLNYSNISDLKATLIIPVDGQLFKVLGYYAATENRDWVFKWNASSTASDNGFDVIELDSAPATGRFERIFEKAYFSMFGGSDTLPDNESIFIAANTYCTTNNRTLWIDENTTFITKPFNVTCNIAGTGTIKLIFEYDISGDTSATGQTIDWTCRYGVLYLNAESVIKDITIDANNSGGCLSGNGADDSQLLGVNFKNAGRSNTFIVGESNYLFWKCTSKDSGLGGNDTVGHQETNTAFGDGLYSRSCHNFRHVFNDISNFSRNGIVSEGDSSTGVSTNPRSFGNYIHDHSGGNIADFAGYWQENTMGGDFSHNTVIGMKDSVVTEQCWGVAMSGIAAPTKAHASYDENFVGGFTADNNIISDCNGGITAGAGGSTTITNNDIKDYHKTGIYLVGDEFGTIDIDGNSIGSRTDASTGDKEFSEYDESAATGLSNAFILVAGDFELVNIHNNTFKSTAFLNGTCHVQISNFATRRLDTLKISNNRVEPWTIEADATEQNGLSVINWNIHNKTIIKNQDLWIGNNTTCIRNLESILIDDCDLYQDGDYGDVTLYAPDIKITNCREHFISGGISRFFFRIGNLEAADMTFDFSNNEIPNAISITTTGSVIATMNNNKLKAHDYTLLTTLLASTAKVYCSGNILEGHTAAGYLVNMKDNSDELILTGNVRDDGTAIYFNGGTGTVQEVNTFSW